MKLIDELYDRAKRRTPRGGLVAITMTEVEMLMLENPPRPCAWPWDPPTQTSTRLFGVEAIVVDCPPLPEMAHDSPVKA